MLVSIEYFTAFYRKYLLDFLASIRIHEIKNSRDKTTKLLNNFLGHIKDLVLLIDAAHD